MVVWRRAGWSRTGSDGADRRELIDADVRHDHEDAYDDDDAGLLSCPRIPRPPVHTYRSIGRSIPADYYRQQAHRPGSFVYLSEAAIGRAVRTEAKSFV